MVRLLETEAGENLLGLGDELAVVLVLVRHGDFQDGFVAGGLAFLRQIADARAADERHTACIRLFLAEDDFEQRGFARAVRPDDGDAVAGHGRSTKRRQTIRVRQMIWKSGYGEHGNFRQPMK